MSVEYKVDSNTRPSELSLLPWPLDQGSRPDWHIVSGQISFMTKSSDRARFKKLEKNVWGQT